MPGNPSHKNALFKKDLADFRSRWPTALIMVRDRVKWNKAMKAINAKNRLRQKRKKKVAT